MTAIITDKLKKQFLSTLLQNVTDSGYYIGIGKSDLWNDSDIVPNPLATGQEERNARYNLQSIKNVLDFSFVSPSSICCLSCPNRRTRISRCQYRGICTHTSSR